MVCPPWFRFGGGHCPVAPPPWIRPCPPPPKDVPGFYVSLGCEIWVPWKRASKSASRGHFFLLIFKMLLLCILQFFSKKKYRTKFWGYVLPIKLFVGGFFSQFLDQQTLYKLHYPNEKIHIVFWSSDKLRLILSLEMSSLGVSMWHSWLEIGRFMGA